MFRLLTLNTVTAHKGRVVKPGTPREEEGLYWGYATRLAASVSAVFSECPYKEGYDCTIGVSSKGESVDNMKMKNFKHVLVVFGGLYGLEATLETDEQLTVADPAALFDHYVDCCPGGGSRTVRTEELMLITMSALRPHMLKANKV
eukprot:Colp12_sorted_trinity150504_noHs@23679